MKDGKYEYKIEINKSITASSNEPISYDFGSTKDISLYIEEGKALITFTMTIKKEIDSYTDSRNYLFRDALRKAYLYHAFKYDRGLSVEYITIHIEGETKVFDDKTPYFPFLQSLISTDSLDLSDKWKSNDFCEKILAYKTSQAYGIDSNDDNDDDKSNNNKDKNNNKNCNLKLSALYSYLASKGKKLEIDRFTCLWTSMNAFYNFYNYCKNPNKKQNTQDRQFIINLMNALSCGKDMPNIGAIKKVYPKVVDIIKAYPNIDTIKKLYTNIEDIKKAYPNIEDIIKAHPKIEDAKKAYPNMEDIIEEYIISEKKIYQKLQDYLYIKACSYIAKLDFNTSLYDQYSQNKTVIANLPDGSKDYSNHFDEMSAIFQISQYGLLLLALPYYWRCKFVHGDSSTLLFHTYDDWHIAVLKNLNFVLDKFLNNNIPKMFDSDFIKLIK